MLNDIVPSGAVTEESLTKTLRSKIERVRDQVKDTPFYPIIIKEGEVNGKVSATDADNHYNIEGMRGKSVYTMGPQAYYVALRALSIAKEVIHFGEEPLMLLLAEGTELKFAKDTNPGRADLFLYSGRVPTDAEMAIVKSHASGPILFETPPLEDQSDQMTYEFAIQKAGFVSGFLGYPGMGFDTSARGRPAMFIARNR
jgi:hypothetical protein